MIPIPLSHLYKCHTRAGGAAINYAVSHVLLDNYATAIDIYQDALEIARNVGNKRAVGLILANLADLATQMLRFDMSIRYLNQALPVYQETDDIAGMGRVEQNLGWLFTRLGNFAEAYEIGPATRRT